MATRRRSFCWHVLGAPRFLLDSAVTGFCWLGASIARRSLFRKLYLGPLLRRSAALRGAVLREVAVRPLPKLSDARRAAYDIELAVAPRDQTARWSVADLALVAPGARPSRPELDRVVGEVLATSVWRNGSFRPCPGVPKFRGTRRLKLRVAIDRNTRNFRLRYYLEVLGRHRPATGATVRQQTATGATVRQQTNTSTLRGSRTRMVSSPPRDVSAGTAPVGPTAASRVREPHARVARPSALDAQTRPHYPV